MIFTEYRFLTFFLVVFAVHWLLRSRDMRKIWLLMCSYFFYAAWDWRFLSLIVASTLFDYVVGILIKAKEGDNQSRKRLLIASIVFNLGMLGVFKYFNFFLDSAILGLQGLGLEPHPVTLQIILPVGISFYTFQTMSYTIDVFKRELEPKRNLLDVALFVGFFPQLVAGPIVRAIDFLPQLNQSPVFRDIRWRACIVLFLMGFFKKACVSDNISIYIEAYFSHPETYDSLAAVLGVFLYSIQIYCDFSGYSDMAIATAAMLGYNFCDNFAFPYFSGNIQDFWRRWHISLSSWLRDYLYIPLGGSRGSKLFRYRNLMLTMLLGGLWHGAAWRFVIWGGLHGVALVAHREWDQRVSHKWRTHFLWKLFAMGLTFYWISLAWIFFRASNMQDALVIAKSYLGVNALSHSQQQLTALNPQLWIPILVLLIAHVAACRGLFDWLSQKSPGWVFAAGLGVFVAVTTALMATEASPFIYFQF